MRECPDRMASPTSRRAGTRNDGGPVGSAGK